MTNGPDRIWNRSFISIFVANMALTLGQFMSNAILSLYAGSIGAAASAIGILMSLFAVSAILLRFISGPVIDTYNKKYVVMLAGAAMAAAYIGFGLARSVRLLFVLRLIQGGGMAFGNACCLAMVSQTLPKDKYNTGIGYYSVAQVVSQAVGVPLGLWLAELLGYRITFFVNTAIIVLSIFLASRVRLDYARTSKLVISLKNIIAKEALLPAALMLCIMVGFTVLNSFLALFASERGIAGNSGLFFTVSAVAMVITRPLIGRLTDRYGIVRTLIPALFANVASFVLIGVSQSIYPILLAGLISSFGFGACQPAVQALCMKSVGPARRGAASCTNYLGMDIGHLLGPSVAGLLAQNFGYTAMWNIMTVPFIAGMLFAFLGRARLTRIETDFAAGDIA